MTCGVSKFGNITFKTLFLLSIINGLDEKYLNSI